MKNIKLYLKILVLILISSSVFSEVYVNRLWDDAAQAFVVTDLFLEGVGVTLDRGYQNAYGLEAELEPGPPFYFEAGVWTVNISDTGIVEDWGSLTINSGGFDPLNPFRVIVNNTAGINYWIINGPLSIVGTSLDPITIEGDYNINVYGTNVLGENFENSFDVDFSYVNFKTPTSEGMFNCLFDFQNGHVSFDHCNFTGITNEDMFCFFTFLDLQSPTPDKFWNFNLTNCIFDGIEVGYTQLMSLNHLNNITIENNEFKNITFAENQQATLMDIRDSDIESIKGNSVQNNTNSAFHLYHTELDGDCYIQTSNDLPIVTHTIQGFEDVNLTIDSGTVIKMYDNSIIHIDGNMYVDGAVFTSWRDDTYGGDSDMNLDSAYIEYWNGIYIDSTGNLTIKNSKVCLADNGTYVLGGMTMDSCMYLDNQFTGLGLEPRGNQTYYVENTSFLRTQEYNGTSGIGLYYHTQFSESSSLYIDNVTSVQNNRDGLRLATYLNKPSIITVKNSNFSGNGGAGIYANLDPGVTRFDVTNTYLSANGEIGIQTNNYDIKNATMQFESNVIAGNGFKLYNNGHGANLNGLNTINIVNNTFAYNLDRGIISDFNPQDDAAMTNNVFYKNDSYGYYMWYPSHPYFGFNYFWGNNDGNLELGFKDSTGTWIYTVEEVQALGHPYSTNQHVNPEFVPEIYGQIETIEYFDYIDLTVIVSTNSFTDKELKKCILKADTATDNWYYVTLNNADSIWILGDATEVAQAGETFVVFDYHLLDISPMVEGGLSTYVTVLEDIEGDNRVLDGDENLIAIVDVGADEYNPDAGQTTPINITNPPTDTLLITNDKYTLNFEVEDGITHVDIFYKVNYDDVNVDSGWISEAANIDASSGEYEWTIPWELSTNCRIKITDNANLETYGISNNFMIKYHILTRIDASGNFDDYTDPDDEWQFDNTEANMWPATTWINYGFHVDPHTNLQYPVEFTDPTISAKNWDFPSWLHWVDAFGVDACYFDGWLSKIYKPSAIKKWASIKHDWVGSCFGLAITNLMAFQDKAAFEARDEIGNYNNLYDLTITDERRNLINTYFAYQFGKTNVDHTTNNISNTPNETLREIIKMLDSSQVSLSDRILTFCDTSTINNQGCHAINPYYVDNVKNIFNIYVYDNNFPNDQTIVEIDTLANSWKYDKFNWEGDKKLWLENQLSDYFAFAEMSSKMNFNNNLVAVSDNFEIYFSHSDSTKIASRSFEIGLYGDSLFNNVPNGRPITPVAGAPIDPVGYLVPDGEWRCNFYSVADSISWMRVFTPNSILEYSREAANTESSDQLLFNSVDNELWVFNPDSGTRTYRIESIAIVPDSEFVIKVTDIEITVGDSTGFSPVNNTGLKIINQGNQKTYNINLSLAGVYLEDEFTFYNVTLPANCSQHIVPKLEDLMNNHLKILIDVNSDGTIDDSIFVEETSTDINDHWFDGLPKEYELAQNYPNPFNIVTGINYSLPKASLVKLSVYNINGQLVNTLVSGMQEAGYHSVQWDAVGMASGIYLYKLEAGEFIGTKKMVLLK